MHGRIATVVLLALLLSPLIGSGIPSTDKPAEPEKFFHEFIGLNDGADSNGRCNTIWYKAVFKGGVYDPRETVWA